MSPKDRSPWEPLQASFFSSNPSSLPHCFRAVESVWDRLALGRGLLSRWPRAATRASVLVLVSGRRSFRLWPDDPLFGADRWFTSFHLPSAREGPRQGGPLPGAGAQRKETLRGVSRTGSEGAPALIEGHRPDAPNPRLCNAKQARRSRNCRAPVRGELFPRRGASPRRVWAEISWPRRRTVTVSLQEKHKGWSTARMECE